MASEIRHQVDFSSTNDPDLDAELIRYEDELRTVEEIVATCRRYGVRARYETPDGILEIDSEGVPKPWP